MNTIYTVAIGGRYTKTRWARDCLKAWERYCDRHNLNLHVQTKATYPFRERSEDPKFEKFNFIHQDFDGSILVVDLDTVPVPDMPNVFDLCSDRNITCRVNPNWGPGHHFFLWSQSERFDDLFTGLSWPVFGDITTERREEKRREEKRREEKRREEKRREEKRREESGCRGRSPMCGFMSAAAWCCCRRMSGACSRKTISA